MHRLIFGLDIRNDAVSSVLIKTGFKGSVIEAHHHIPISDPKDIGTTIDLSLEAIREKVDTAGSICIASFPSDQIFFRNIKVPFSDQKKIRQILPFELETTLPFSVSDIVIDFHTVMVKDHSDIIAAAIEKSRLELYLERLAPYDIVPEIVTASGYGSVLCLTNFSDAPENALVLDAGFNNASLFAIVSGNLHLVRSFPIASAVPFRTESLCTNIERTLSTFDEVFDADFKPDLLFFTGYGQNDKDAAAEMERTLEIPIKHVDFVRDADAVLTNHPGRSWDPGRMNDALALCLMELKGIRGLNFRRGPFAARRVWAKHKKEIVRTGILGGLVIALALLNIWVDSYLMEKKVARMNEQITRIFQAAFPDVKKIVDPVQQMRVKIEAQNKVILLSGESGGKIRVIDILEAISRHVSEKKDVNVSKLVVGGGNVLISGDTDTFNTVNDIKTSLEKVEFFKKIIITSTSKNKSEDRIDFNMKIEL